MQLLQAPPLPFHELYFVHLLRMADNFWIWFFVLAVLFDILTGFAKSMVTHKVTSTKGTDGLIKHSTLLLIVIVLYPLFEVSGFAPVADALVTFYILFYGVSVVENLSQMGLPVPSWAKTYLYKLSDEYNNSSHVKKEDDKHA